MSDLVETCGEPLALTSANKSGGLSSLSTEVTFWRLFPCVSMIGLPSRSFLNYGHTWKLWWMTEILDSRCRTEVRKIGQDLLSWIYQLVESTELFALAGEQPFE